MGRITVKELHNKKRQKKILFLTALFAVIFIAGALFEFNITMTGKEESATNEYLIEWTEQNARMIHLREDSAHNLTAYLVYRNINDVKKQQENLEKRASTDLLTGA